MNDQAIDLVTFSTSTFLITLKDNSTNRFAADEPFFMFRGHTFSACEDVDFWNLSNMEYRYLLKYSDLC